MNVFYVTRYLIFLITNHLISTNQSWFKLGDSSINQLLSITHGIYSSFDQGYEVRGVFLDISRAIDKIWHEGIIFKFKQNGISGKLLHLIKDFLVDRKQREVLNGQYFSLMDIQGGVPPEFLEPLLF